MSNKILLLPGDGIGPEIIAIGKNVINAVEKVLGIDFILEEALIGGIAVDQTNQPLPSETLKLAKSADAIVLGAVGGSKWDKVARDKKPETGLLQIRKELGLFANLRPAIMYPELTSASSLKPEIIADLDLMIVRELTGGIYFGEPRGIKQDPAGNRIGFNTMTYSEPEIIRIAKVACEIALARNKQITSVDKANVLEVSSLWREVVTREVAKYSEIELNHMYVDNATMQLVKQPKQFDVIVTSNMFGDILSDCAAMLTGSIGMLPSASLNNEQIGLYEPVHGSAPDIAGQDIANPIATVLSIAMMMRYSLQKLQAADLIESAVRKVIAQGIRTSDLITGDNGSKETKKFVGTKEMGKLIVENILVKN